MMRKQPTNPRAALLDQRLQAMFEALKAGTPPALLDTLHHLQRAGSRRQA
jgi:hypothetical protein